MDNNEGYLMLGAMRVNVPGHYYKNGVQLISDQKNKLTYVCDRLKYQKL